MTSNPKAWARITVAATIAELVLDFLDLPDWEPDARESRKKHRYETMDPATRRRLEQYFEPHNQRLYEHLGTDLGW
jgi:hypothetical protein